MTSQLATTTALGLAVLPIGCVALLVALRCLVQVRRRAALAGPGVMLGLALVSSGAGQATANPTPPVTAWHLPALDRGPVTNLEQPDPVPQHPRPAITTPSEPTSRRIPATAPATPRHPPSARAATTTREPHHSGPTGLQHEAASYVVQPGDSLWAITARLLPANATAREIADSWPLIWRANRDVIGANPSLIHPGQQLTIPAQLRGGRS